MNNIFSLRNIMNILFVLIVILLAILIPQFVGNPEKEQEAKAQLEQKANENEDAKLQEEQENLIAQAEPAEDEENFKWWQIRKRRRANRLASNLSSSSTPNPLPDSTSSGSFSPGASPIDSSIVTKSIRVEQVEQLLTSMDIPAQTIVYMDTLHKVHTAATDDSRLKERQLYHAFSLQSTVCRDMIPKDSIGVILKDSVDLVALNVELNKTIHSFETFAEVLPDTFTIPRLHMTLGNIQAKVESRKNTDFVVILN